MSPRHLTLQENCGRFLTQEKTVSAIAVKEHDRDGELEEKTCLWESTQDDDMKQGSSGKKLMTGVR